jgi:pimeloyl-ACP methyl ester carboxylesterase
MMVNLGAAQAQPKPDVAAIKPFQINVDDAVLKDLKERLARTRFPDTIDDSGWDYGVDLGYMKELVGYWKDKYDWRAQEKKLNELPQFTTEIDGLPIHFVHQRSKEKNALPLVIIHGWPGSFYEFHKIIGPLTDPVAHGGKAEDAFHVVCPSLPGFGFSGKPSKPGWSMSRMSDVVAKLMARLGYTRYAAQGGDWGAGVANWLGTYDSEHVVGVHLNFLTVGPPNKDDPYNGVTAEEKQRYEKRRDELQNQRAYGAIQGTRPQTLGFSLNDSPAGLAAWVVDKFWAWSDHRGNLDNSFSRDELLTNVMIYWVTETPTSAARIYFEREQYTGGRKAGRVPVGVALFPKEINVPPRKWAEAQFNLVHWTEMPRGGHFAALEQPTLLLEDIRTFSRKLR